MKRKTASAERYMFFFGNRYPIYFSFAVRIKGSLDSSLLKRALDRLKSRHIMLATHTIMTEDKKQFITDQGTGEFEIRTFANDNRSWQELVLELMSYPFDVEKGPFVRFGLKNLDSETELYVIFHHATADGVSGIIFLKDLFNILAGRTPEGPNSRGGLFLFQSLMPEVEEVLAKREKPDWATKKEEVKGEAVILPFALPALKIHSEELDQATTNKLVACAKAMQISVQSLLGAAFLRAYAECFGAESGYQRTIQIPVDCRKYVKQEYRDTIGAFNSIIKMPIDCSPKRSIKQIAQEIGSKLKEKTSDYKDVEGFYFFKGYFDDVADPEAMMCEFKPDPLDYDFSLSNLGRIDLEASYGEWEIESIYGPTFTAINGEQVIGLNTHNGFMRFTYIYDKDIFPEQTGRRIWKRAFELLLELIADK
ncbi:MAG: hypothetical protein JW822_02190 [Spirochaetales bacterium]|nr:hypothetical protein [Spirochaetales bacterium]